ncbi:MAG TPA: outer membrane beta-barrel protein [Vicinamibacterales bacterium]|nr:outer membrane beta-barrel protein [Vicinamibacterales bacterium]
MADFRTKLRITTLAASLMLAAAAVMAAPADDIKALLEQRKAAEAYALAKQNPGEIGNPAFDFYFGIAAIDSGHAGEGVLALERYVINFPDNLEARLELARGYFVLGEDARAREEFREVLKANPPPNVAANIERFMNALDARQSTYRTTTGVFAEVGYGYDSNVNGGVGNAGISVPVFGSVRVAPNGVETAADFAWVALGGEIIHPIAPGLAVFANGRMDGKYNGGGLASEFDQNNVAVNGGLTYLQDKNLYRFTATHATVWVDNKRFRDVDGISGELSHQIDELQSAGPFVQIARLGYTGDNAPRDADFYSAGVNYRKAFIGPFQPLLTASANIADEHNRRDRPDLGRDIYGGRVALALTPAPKWFASVGLAYQNSKYSAVDPLLATTRQDDYYALDATVGYAFSRKLSLRGELMLSDNQSNIELYEYKRNIVGVKLRYDF